MLLFLSADSPEPKGRKAVVMLTLRKLKEMVESPKKGEKKPSCKSLREGKYPVVAQKIIKNKVDTMWRCFASCRCRHMHVLLSFQKCTGIGNKNIGRWFQ